MSESEMPFTAFAALMVVVCLLALVLTLFLVPFLYLLLKDRTDINRAKAIAASKKEIKKRALRLKEEEARLSAEKDDFFRKYKEFVDGL